MIDFLPSIQKPITTNEARLISPLVLAFVGDGVQTLYVRSSLVLSTTLKQNDLHHQTAERVKAVTQAEMVDKLLPILTDDELAVYKRARNSNPNTLAKHASVADYKKASGLEAVIGYLYLTGQSDRLNYLLDYSTLEEK